MTVSDDQLRALGRITVAYGGVELTVSIVTGLFVQNFAVGRVLLADMGVDTMLGKLAALAREIHGDDGGLRDDLLAFVGSARAAVERRNRVTHASWGQSPDASPGDPVSRSRYSAKKGELRFQSDIWTAADFDEIADALNEVTATGDQLVLRLIDAFPDHVTKAD